jgi:hypothetical protein
MSEWPREAPELRPDLRGEATRVRGTQSFVGTLSWCWKRPGLVGREILWRWAYGIPVLWALIWNAVRILSRHTQGTMDVGLLGLDRRLVADPVGALAGDPLGVVGKVTGAVGLLLPDVLRVAVWLLPLMVVGWIVVSSVGRTWVLRGVDGRLELRVGTLMVLQALRSLALLGCFGVWIWAVLRIAAIAVTGPIAAGQEPSLVLYCSLVILASLGLFTLWAVASWALSVAPLLAMLRGVGPGASLRAAFRLGPLRAKLVENNLVLGIVKIMLLVLAMVFSATPLPFESVTTPEFLAWWWAGVAVFYLVASDFFHVARMVAYLRLWQAYQSS